MSKFDNTMIYLLTGLGTLAVILLFSLSNILSPKKPLLSPYAVQHFAHDGGLVENYRIQK